MDIYEYQLQNNHDKIKHLLTLAKSHVPFYKDAINNNIEYYLQSYENWSELPIISKELLLSQYDCFINKSIDLNTSNIKVVHTSGSTATPLKVLKDKYSEMKLLKKLWDVRRIWGKDVYTWPLVYLYRNVDDIYRNVLRLGNNDEYLNLSKNYLDEYIDKINDFKPRWLIGPPIATTTLSSYILENNINIHSVELAELFGEMVLPHQKNIIERAFNCKTINHYGARELGVLSYECKCGHMHAWDDYYFFEIISNKTLNNNDGGGEIVVTSFTNNIVPLIRYSLGDLCILKFNQYKCPYNNSRLEIIPTYGRSASLIQTHERVVSSGVLDTVFSRLILKYPLSIKQFQVIQVDMSIFEVKIIAGMNINENIINELINSIKSFLGEVEISIKHVDSISIEASGKSRNFMSLVKVD